MKKLAFCAFAIYFFTSVPYKKVAAVETIVSANNVNAYIANVYSKIDFGECGKLDFEVFEKAFRGYLNLQSAGKLNEDKQILTICDLSKSSATYRLWIIDLKQNKLLVNDYVAHGQGSGDEFATVFSNKENSHQTSLGFYVTGETYIGEHGESLRLHGMDNGFNNAAYSRAIVVHGADYVSNSFVQGQKRLGRSWGCPAVSNKIAGKVITTIKDGTCLFVYHPDKKYERTAYWMNKKIDRVPSDNMYDMHFASATPKRDTIYVYKRGPYAQAMLDAYKPLRLPLL